MPVLSGALMATPSLGSLWHAGTDLMYAVLLMMVLLAVARLPWRRQE